MGGSAMETGDVFGGNERDHRWRFATHIVRFPVTLPGDEPRRHLRLGEGRAIAADRANCEGVSRY